MEGCEIEQMNMKFCSTLGKTTTQTNEMLIRGYGDAAVSQEMVYKWSDIFMLVLN
jgi:hypothetical protein